MILEKITKWVTIVCYPLLAYWVFFDRTNLGLGNVRIGGLVIPLYLAIMVVMIGLPLILLTIVKSRRAKKRNRLHSNMAVISPFLLGTGVLVYAFSSGDDLVVMVYSLFTLTFFIIGGALVLTDALSLDERLKANGSGEKKS